MTRKMTVQEWVTRFNFPQKPFSRKDVRQILRNWQDDRVKLQQQNADLMVVLDELLKSQKVLMQNNNLDNLAEDMFRVTTAVVNAEQLLKVNKLAGGCKHL